MFRRMFPGGRETTITSIKSEITKNVLAALIIGIAGNLAQTGLLLIVFILWWKIDTFNAWWIWFREWWTFYIAFLILWWIAVPLILLIIRLGMELWNQHWPPVYEAANPAMGVLGPFRSKKKQSAMNAAYLMKFGYIKKESDDE